MDNKINNHFFLLLAFITLSIIMLPATSFAEPDETIITETDILSALPIVTSASRMAQPLNHAPSSITIIDRELIRQSGAQTWVDIFRLVPGFQSYFISASRPAISSHGVGAEFPNHLEVMIDGRSVYEPIFSTVGWSNIGIDLHDIDRIEIVRGSNAAAYGSNAFLGAVNIITINPTQVRGQRLHMAAGSQNTQSAKLTHNGNLDALSYRVALNFNHNDGFPSVSRHSDPEDNGALKDSRDLTALNLRGVYTPNLQDTLDIQLGISHENTGWGDPDSPAEFFAASFNTNFESLKWTREINPKNRLKLHLYHNSFRGKNDYAPLASQLLSETLGFPVSSDELPILAELIFGVTGVEDQPLQLGFGSLRSDRYDIELEHQKVFSDLLRLTWGAGYRHERIEGDTLLDTGMGRETNARRLFAHGEWRPMAAASLNAGFMLEDNDIVDTIMSSRFGTNLHINANNTFRVAFARGTRSPSLLEAYEFQVDRVGPLVIDAIRVSDPALGEEKLTSIELGYISHWPQQHLSLDARIFREELRDMIRGIRVPTAMFVEGPSLDELVRLTTNSLSLDIEGLELQLDYRPTQQLHTRIGYAYLDYDGLLPSVGGNINDFGERATKHSLSVLVSYQLTSALAFSTHIYHMSEVTWDRGDFVDDFTRTDMQLCYRFAIGGGHHGKLTLVAQNLGEKYAEFNQNNIFETRYFLNVSLELP